MRGIAHRRPCAVGERGFFGAAAAFNFSFLMLLVLVPVAAARQGDSLAVIGLLTAVPGLMQLGLRVIAGVLSDVWGPRRVMHTCFVCSALAAVPLLGSSPGLAAFAVAQLLNGLARGAFWPAAQTYATRLPGDAAGALSRMFTLTSTGSILALLLAGGIASRLGFPVAFGASGLAAVAALVLTRHLPRAAARARPEGLRELLGPLGRLIRQRPILVAGALAFAASVPNALASSFYPVFALQLGFGAALATALVALRQGGNIGGASLFAPLLRRAGIRTTVIGGLGAVALSLAAAPVLRVPVLFAAGLALSGLSGQMVNLGYIWFVTQNSRPEERGAAIGAAGIWWAAAVLLTPALFGAVAAHLGFAATFVLAGGAVAALGGMLALRPGWLRLGEPEAA